MYKNKLKIAIGTDAFPPTIDGISNVAQNYAAQINKDLGEAVVVTPKNPNQQDYKYPYKIYRYTSAWVPSSEGYAVGLPFANKLHQNIIDFDFDLLHSHAPLATSYFFNCVAQKKKIPVVLTYHTKYEYDVEKRVPTRAGKNFAYKFLLKYVNAADEVWVTSEGTGESLRNLGYKGDWVVMPNGCDLPKTNVSPQYVAMIKRKHNIPGDVTVLLYSGRLIWYKNVKLIIDACKLLKSYGKKFKLVMLGFGADERSIRRYARHQGLKDDIIWTGQISNRQEILGYYGIADLLLFPSVFDTNGLVVREAAACATPSLLIKGSCAAEGIEDRDTGFLCKETALSIADTVNDIMYDKDLLKTVGKNAQDKIYISWEDAVKKAYERYQVVIQNFYNKQ